MKYFIANILILITLIAASVVFVWSMTDWGIFIKIATSVILVPFWAFISERFLTKISNSVIEWVCRKPKED